MYPKRVAISNIISTISSCTEMHFQEKMVLLLNTICQYYNVEFEAVQPSNGDAKNDGWIPSKKIFFAMYSPNDGTLSQLTQIKNKLEDDLDGLCNHVYNLNQWGGEIKEFYLIVNTHDKELPADPNRLIDTVINNIKRKYGKEFTVKVIPAKNIASYLMRCDIELLDNLKDVLDVYTIEHSISVSEIHEFIDEYVSFLANQDTTANGTDFKRTDIIKKIELNNLQNLKESIISRMNAVAKVDKFLSTMNSEGWDDSNWVRTKNHIINKYNELSNLYDGENLYNSLLEELMCNDLLLDSKATILEAIVINIFIKCDIFSKE